MRVCVCISLLSETMCLCRIRWDTYSAWAKSKCIPMISFEFYSCLITTLYPPNYIHKCKRCFVMPPHLGAGSIDFGLSVRPSVRSPKYPLSTCTRVRWSIQPTMTVLRHVRPSVRPSGKVSGPFPENAWREWPEILHANVSWPPSELISLCSRFVDLSNFGAILT